MRKIKYAIVSIVAGVFFIGMRNDGHKDLPKPPRAISKTTRKTTPQIIIPKVIAVMHNVKRPGNVTALAISAASRNSVVAEVHVWGNCPSAVNIHCHNMSKTLYHAAHDAFASEFTGDYLAHGNKFTGTDDIARTKWRSLLALDMWAVLREARGLFPFLPILYLENDAILKNGTCLALLLKDMVTSRIPATSCYSPSNRKGVYGGSGNVCFVFMPDIDPTPHLLAYHMVQPADWILSDFSKGMWPMHPCANHGTDGNHISTRVI